MIDLKIKEAWLALRRAFLIELKGFDVSESEAYLLTIIPKEGINSTSIPSLLGLALGSATNILIKLENKGLIVRQKDISDRRLTKIFLTETGVAKRKIISSIIKQQRMDLIQKIGSREIDQAIAVLDKIIAINNKRTLKKIK